MFVLCPEGDAPEPNRPPGHLWMRETAEEVVYAVAAVSPETPLHVCPSSTLEDTRQHLIAIAAYPQTRGVELWK